MVSYVTAVPKTRELRREDGRKSNFSSNERGFSKSFSETLEKAMNERRAEPMEYHTSMYGSDSKLTMFPSQTTEYYG